MHHFTLLWDLKIPLSMLNQFNFFSCGLLGLVQESLLKPTLRDDADNCEHLIALAFKYCSWERSVPVSRLVRASLYLTEKCRVWRAGMSLTKPAHKFEGVEEASRQHSHDALWRKGLISHNSNCKSTSKNFNLLLVSGLINCWEI